MLIKLVAVFCLVFGLVSSEKATFNNYRVYSVVVETEQQLIELRRLESSAASGIQFWQSPSGLGRRTDIMVAPHQMATFAELADKLKLSSRVMVDDVQR